MNIEDPRCGGIAGKTFRCRAAFYQCSQELAPFEDAPHLRRMPGAWLQLVLMRLMMTSFATLHDFSTLDLERERTASKRAVFQALRPLRGIGAIVSRCLEALARLE